MAQTTQRPESAQEITMRVRIEHDGKYTTFILRTNGYQIAVIERGGLTAIKPWEIYSDKLGINRAADSYPEAIEIVSDAIERHFAQYGINVEFVKE